jgi:hypothetical protein
VNPAIITPVGDSANRADRADEFLWMNGLSSAGPTAVGSGVNGAPGVTALWAFFTPGWTAEHFLPSALAMLSWEEKFTDPGELTISLRTCIFRTVAPSRASLRSDDDRSVSREHASGCNRLRRG